ncbi:histidine kinase [Streptomyces sp. NBC_00663]|uniref:sensor histidine kinase n=1 Tax=Streptomyces sp. NBC_00663 TaxID=2975801 RepID=UPI002E347392|nr:histidine kinase [Streptomyces sp. NBC_00663]
MRRSTAVMPPKYAMTLMSVILAGFAVIGVANLIKVSHTPQGLTLASAVVSCCYVLQMAHCSPSARGRLQVVNRRFPWTLALQALLSLSPVLFLGHQSGALAGFLAGACTVLLRAKLAYALFGVINVAVLVTALATGDDLFTAAFMVLSCASIGLITTALSRLVDLVTELHRRREESAWVAVSRERVRFTQDLHDLFSYSLSAITLKTELANRLIGKDDAQARQELSESLAITRAALADVRTVVHGRRSLRLVDEVELSKRVLDSAGIEMTTEGDFRHIEPRVGNVLAVVLREAVTNMLRHSRATRCEITLATTCDGQLRQLELTVANDGVSGPAADGPHVASESQHGGSGLEHMAARAGQVGGSLRTESVDGWFVLVVRVPALRPPAAPPVTVATSPTTFEHLSSGPEHGL